MPSVDLAKVIAEKDAALAGRIAKRDEDLTFARALSPRRTTPKSSGTRPGPIPRKGWGRISPPCARWGTDKPSDRTLQVYQLEYYKKFSIPFGAFFFVVLAFPLGLLAKKSGSTMGFGVGILISVIYWALLLGGQTLGTRLAWSPFWSIWAPNAAVLLVGLALWIARLRTK